MIKPFLLYIVLACRLPKKKQNVVLHKITTILWIALMLLKFNKYKYLIIKKAKSRNNFRWKKMNRIPNKFQCNMMTWANIIPIQWGYLMFIITVL